MSTHSVTFQPSGTTISCRNDQTLVDAAHEQGVSIDVGCENGVCLICQGERTIGEFQFRNSLGQELLKTEDRVLCCVAQPLSDAEIYMPNVHAADHLDVVTLACQIAKREQLPDNVWRFELRAPAGKAVEFWPGQYLMLHVENNRGNIEQIPYSIANAPSHITKGDTRLIELHIANHGDNTKRVIHFLNTAVIARVTLPMGDCFITPRLIEAYRNTPFIMIASGSGFSQVKSLIEGILAINPQHEIHLYWSNKNSQGFYLNATPAKWAADFAHLNYHPIQEQASDDWTGRVGLIYQIIQQDFANLSHTQVFACGSPNMVYGTLDNLAAQGLTQTNMHSDVFAYAPRTGSQPT